MANHQLSQGDTPAGSKKIWPTYSGNRWNNMRATVTHMRQAGFETEVQATVPTLAQIQHQYGQKSEPVKDRNSYLSNGRKTYGLTLSHYDTLQISS